MVENPPRDLALADSLQTIFAPGLQVSHLGMKFRAQLINRE
jgi:hypothetical protein